MSRIKHSIKKRFDGVLALLVSFVFLLAVLFAYIKNIDEAIKNYYDYSKTIVKLDSYNQDLDNSFIRSYRYLDNDHIVYITKLFDQNLIALKQNKLTENFGSEVVRMVNEIIRKYKIKTELIENFKTLNSRITSSVHYLYELQKSVNDDDSNTIQSKNILRIILFKTGQIFFGKNLDVIHIQRDLEKLSVYREKSKDIDYFYMHMQQLLMDIRALNAILEKNKVLQLEASIDSLSAILNNAYIKNQKKEKIIGFLLFVFALAILLILLNTYMKGLKNKKEVFYLAYHDILTKLPNRMEFERYISELIEKVRTNARKTFAVLFIDLDRFKVINDTLGHDVGDKMLVILSDRIAKVLGRENFLARLGGDEFVAIIEDSQSLKMLDSVVAEVASVIRDTIHINEYSLNTSASIGIAMYPQDGVDKSTLLRHADSAMYHAKESGKDTYSFYTDELSVNIQRRLYLEQALVNALHDNEFTLYYQPQYDLNTKKITGAEVLVRWYNGLLGDVSPEEFISVAEETGMIIELGYYIFEKACNEYMNWLKNGAYPNLLAINISSVQLRQPDAFVKFRRIIEETGMMASHIEFELTERYIMEYATEELTILDDLRILGCRISIDDFGTGYSSMSYLKSLAIDTIKIDKSFILELPYNQHDAEVSKAIIVLSKSLGYEVIAEGIENFEQEHLLKSYNCDMGQGYFFGKPMNSDDFVKFYKNNNTI